MSDYQLFCGDCLNLLSTLETESVQCCATSPPYFGLRNYGVDGQIGLEETPEKYVEKLVAVFREVRRVLRDDGTLWLNLGDSYAGSGGAGGDYSAGGLKEGQPKYKSNFAINRAKDRHSARWGGGNLPATGDLKPKDLIGIPWMVAFALRSDGWYLRSDIIWSKPNPMPESVADRPTKAHEYIFLLSKSAKYYYDSEAIKERSIDGISRPDSHPTDRKRFPSQLVNGVRNRNKSYAFANKRSVWTVSTQPYAEAHFATFPPKLIEPCILAGCPIGGTVIDPFNGSGTTGQVALQHGRKYIGIELNPEYLEMTRRRLAKVEFQPPLIPIESFVPSHEACDFSFDGATV